MKGADGFVQGYNTQIAVEPDCGAEGEPSHQ
jgi:hypothetical protein